MPISRKKKIKFIIGRAKKGIKRAVRTPGSPFKKSVLKSKLKRQSIDYTQATPKAPRFSAGTRSGRAGQKVYKKVKSGVAYSRKKASEGYSYASGKASSVKRRARVSAYKLKKRAKPKIQRGLAYAKPKLSEGAKRVGTNVQKYPKTYAGTAGATVLVGAGAYGVSKRQKRR